MAKIHLDAGHGGKDPGALGNGLKEKDITLPVTLKVGSILNKYAIATTYSRTTDIFVELSERAQMANNTNADLFISIHTNAHNSNAQGVETYSFPGSKNGARLAKCIQDSVLSSKLYTKNRGIKTAKFAVLRQTKMPAALIEMAFITNEQDARLLNDMRDDFAEAIAEGILDYLGIKYRTVTSESAPKPQGTPIISPSKSSVKQMQAWARSKGAHQRFIDIAPTYWSYYEQTGINPEILYCQAAKETNFGRYTGSVKPEMNNWAGIKTANPAGDKTEDHECFKTPEDGVRAHFNHMGIYCGVDPIGTPHPRWHITKTAGWAGTVKYVEDLGGKWAPNIDYGISIVRDYLQPLYNTKADPPSTNYKALYQDAQGKLNKIKNIVEG